jgi:hypothetical protein
MPEIGEITEIHLHRLRNPSMILQRRKLYSILEYVEFSYTFIAMLYLPVHELFSTVYNLKIQALKKTRL